MVFAKLSNVCALQAGKIYKVIEPFRNLFKLIWPVQQGSGTDTEQNTRIEKK